jgi:putative transcription factor
VQCEVCGRTIMGRPQKTIIEGARLIVCKDCAILGSMSWELSAKEPVKKTSLSRRPIKKRLKTSKKHQQSPFEPSLELIPNFGTLIRQARELKGLSHEDLGRRINEKVSQLKKLESNKMIPNHRLAKKLEYTLKIKLLVPLSKDKVLKKLLDPSQSKAFTLGDLIKNKEKQLEEKESQT